VKAPMPAHWSRRHSVVVDERRRLVHVWHDRFRDPALTVLLVLEAGLIFLGAPLAAKGVPLARPIIETMVLAVVVIVGMLSQRRGAIAAILLGLAAIFGGRIVRVGMPPIVVSVLRRGGNILTFLALSWLVSHAV
jgi:hypothetical protein